MIVWQEEFFSLLAAERGLSSNTIASYKRDLTSFIQFIQIDDLSTITIEDLRSFLRYLQGRGYASSTIYRMVITIRLFFRFLQSEGKIAKENHLLLDTPKIWQALPDIMSVEEISALFAAIDSSTFEGKRDLAIVNLLYGAFLRVSELCSLNFLDVDDTQIKVHGKGGKERIVPIAETAVQALDDYLLERSLTKENNPPLFVTRKGKRITRFFIFSLIKDLAAKANIPKKVSPHTLRHCAATHLLENGADIRVIQELLGHASISTTEKYTHISKAHLQRAFDSFHPRET